MLLMLCLHIDYSCIYLFYFVWWSWGLYKQTVQHNAYDQDPYAKEFGLNISEKLASVEARILPAPWVLCFSLLRSGLSYIENVYLFPTVH